MKKQATKTQRLMLVSKVAIFLAALPIVILHGTLGYAYKPGFYAAASTTRPGQLDEKFDEIELTRKNASINLTCCNVDAIIVVREQPITSRPIKPLTRAQLFPMLQKNQHKRLIVVTFEKSIMCNGPEQVQLDLLTLREWLARLGYERALVLGAGASGTYVLYDSSEI